MIKTNVKPFTDSVAFVSMRFGAPFLTSVLAGAEDAANRMEGGPEAITMFRTNGEEKAKKEILNDIYRGRLVGAVIMVFITPDAKQAKELVHSGIPVILLENRIKGISSVSIDNRRASCDAVGHLVKTGRKNIAIISGGTLGEKNNNNAIMAVREQAYMDTLQNASLDFDKEIREKAMAYSFEEGKDLLDALIKRKKKTDAIFCAAGDLVAMGVIERAAELGIRVPQDLAIIGFDDTDAARLISPKLTTVHQPIREMGKEAFILAVKSMRGEVTKPIDIVLPAELVVRESA